MTGHPSGPPGSPDDRVPPTSFDPSRSLDEAALASLLESEGLSVGAAADAARRLSRSYMAARAEVGEGEGSGGGPGTGGGAAGFFVPGRIEVLGKHTDYAGGRSLVAAMEAGISAVVVGDDAPRIRVIDLDTGSRVDLPLPSEAGSSAAQTDLLSSGSEPATAHPEGSEGPQATPNGWARYPHAWLRRIGQDASTLGIETRGGAVVVLSSSLPRAAGMSSSTALLVALHLALATRWRWAESEIYRRHLGTREALADYLAALEAGRAFSVRSESEAPEEGTPADAGVGTQGGSQDHFAILCARPGRLVRCAFRPTRFEAEIPLPEGWTFALGVSGVAAPKAEESREAYNRLSAQARAIGQIWTERSGGFGEGNPGAFLDAPPATLLELGAALATTPHPDASADTLVRRARQFMEECTSHIPEAHEALLQGAVDLFGRHVERSHIGGREALRNDTPETEALTELARTLGAPAASPFGAGFGGSVWALVLETESADFLARWRDGYHEAFPDHREASRFLRSRPGPPALRVF